MCSSFDFLRYEVKFSGWHEDVSSLSHGLRTMLKDASDPEQFVREILEPFMQKSSEYVMIHLSLTFRHFAEIVQALISENFPASGKFALLRFLYMATKSFDPNLVDKVSEELTLPSNVEFFDIFTVLVSIYRDHPDDSEDYSSRRGNFRLYGFPLVVFFLLCAFHDELEANPRKIEPVAQFIISEGSFYSYNTIFRHDDTWFLRKCSRNQPCKVILMLFQTLIEKDFLLTLLDRDFLPSDVSFYRGNYTVNNEIVKMGYNFASQFQQKDLLRMAGDRTRSILYHYGGFQISKGRVRLFLTWAPQSWGYRFPRVLLDDLVVLYACCRVDVISNFIFRNSNFYRQHMLNMASNYKIQARADMLDMEDNILPIEFCILENLRNSRQSKKDIEMCPFANIVTLKHLLPMRLPLFKLDKLTNNDLYIIQE